jgi:hypothetical protein
MKAKCFLLAGLLALAARGSAAEEHVALRDTPPAVQAAIKSAGIPDPIKAIVRRTQDGATTYVVEFERNNAPNPHLRVGEDGRVISRMQLEPVSETVWPASVDYPDMSAVIRSPLQISDLPGPVRDTVAAHARGREVADIDRENWKGRQVFEVEFKEPGRNPQIHVADDGTVVREEGERRGLKSLFMGTQIEETPPAVQETVKRVVGDREIVDIDHRRAGDRSVFLIEVRTTTGLETLHVAQDGKLLQGSQEGTPPARK